MRTLVDLVEAQVEALDSVAKQEKRSRASLIRQAVDEYLSKRSSAPLDETFGIWRDRKGDGLEFQRRLRNEW